MTLNDPSKYSKQKSFKRRTEGFDILYQRFTALVFILKQNPVDMVKDKHSEGLVVDN